MSAKYAFRCVNCGHLAEPGEAGERSVPAACRICGFGVHFDPVTGVKEYDEDNWEVLADLSATARAKLEKERGLDDDQVVEHEPFGGGEGRAPQLVSRTADDAVVAESNQ